VVGAWGEDSGNGDPLDNSALDSGAAYVFYSQPNSGCPPSFNCPAPKPSDPTSTARLILFPSTPSQVVDNHPTLDLDPQCGVLQVENIPFPKDSCATFSGELQLTAPTPSIPAQLIATAATIRNETGPVSGTDAWDFIRSDIPFACAEFYADAPIGGLAPGSLHVEIDGALEANSADGMTYGSEVLEITGVGMTLYVSSQPGSPPSHTTASWSSSGVPSPETMTAQNFVTGTYEAGPGVIGLWMNIHLQESGEMTFPTSIEATVSTSTGVPSLGVRGFGLLVGAVLGFGALAIWRGRRSRA